MQIYSDQEIIELIDAYMQGSDNADQIGYRTQTYSRDFADRERFLWFLKYISKLGSYQNKRILDVGCGFGWHAFGFSLLDNKNRLVGVDILPSMIDGMTESIETIRKKGVAFDVTPVRGDICDLDLEPRSFDAIYSMEAIEHVHDLKKMFSRCAELLKPGGNIILINDLNALNRKTRSEIIKMWHERETSWAYAEHLRHWRPIEHKDAKPFAIMREEIVRAANPGLDEPTLSALVRITAGLVKPEIEHIARKHVIGALIPRPAIGKYDRCRNPQTGEYAERLLNPFVLANMLGEFGFKAKVQHAFRKFPLSLANQIEFWPLNYLLFNVRPAFIVLGQKL
jgi:SAM-dependent methyltransferase